jgi:ATP/maltotriose-dependent transcriptional regulator MalT
MAEPADQPSEIFVGREKELGVLRSAMEQVRAGRPQVVLIEGPAGIGKTALLDRFLALETDAQALRASGEPWAALVPFGLVDQLIRAGGMSRAGILAARERALPIDEPISVGARILELLSELDAKHPTVLVIDDAHWADLDSLRALLFALRRLVEVSRLSPNRALRESRLLQAVGHHRAAAGVARGPPVAGPGGVRPD